MNELTSNEIRKVADGATSGTSAVTSSIVDMQGATGVIFMGRIATANAGNYLKVAQSDDSGMAGATDLEGSKVTAAQNGEVVAAEIYLPSVRYLQATIVRGAATVTGDLYAVRRVKNRPALNNVTGTIASKILATPAEGTA